MLQVDQVDKMETQGQVNKFTLLKKCQYVAEKRVAMNNMVFK